MDIVAADLIQMLAGTVSRHPDRAAIICGQRRMSYLEMDRESNRVASALMEMGVAKGERVATLMTNSPEFVTVYFGTLKAGAIPVPLDVRYRADELVSLFDNCTPKVLAAEGEFLRPLASELQRFGSIKRVIDVDGGCAGQFPAYKDIIAAASDREAGVALSPDDIGIISYTGGPTSRPRGAALSHRSLVFEAKVAGDGFRMTEEDRMMLFALPMYHMFGMASALLASAQKGGSVVIVPGTGRSVTSFLETVEREKGTIYVGVPYIYALAIRVAEREGMPYDLSSVRLWGSGGATLTVDIIEQFKRYYGADILDVWGLTESVSHISYHPPDGPRKIGSCGTTLPGWEIRAMDDDDALLPPGQPGEIVVRGPIMLGYYNNPGATAEAIRGGWLHTGDLGYVDEDGYLYLTGMKKDMIILKGQNIYPADIEEVLCRHDKVAGAAVVGIPDRLRGEIVGAVVKLKEGATASEQELRNFCQARLADYKLPKKICFVATLPERGAPGKKRLEDYLADMSSVLSRES